MTALLIQFFDIIGVFSGAEAHKTILINVDLEWVDTSDKDEDSEVILVAIDEVRVINVIANNVGIQDILTIRDFCLALEDANTFGVSTIDRFAYPKTRRVDLSLYLELFVVFSLLKDITDR